MRNFRITLEYDGSGFSGWQVQPGLRTVQGELQKAIGELAGGSGAVKITGAGRTDAGVHAVGQVASAAFETGLEAGIVLKALRGKLPPDILVRAVEDAPLSFNARFDARSRRYHYIFITRRTALWRGYYYYAGEHPDIAAMRAQAKALGGEHDFSAFAASGSGVRSTVCNVMRADIIENSPLVIFSITADRFMYNMVRSVAGVLLRAAEGKDVSMAEILASGDRAAAGPTLPTWALYLMEVRY